jgi:capsule biosynthesis phosphatase
MKTYVFDIDGTICNSAPGDYESAVPIMGRIDRINQLYEEGNNIIFNTARGMGRYKNAAIKAHAEFYNLTIKQLSNWGVKYHCLFMGKPSGDYYVDDKGVNDEDFFNAAD